MSGVAIYGGFPADGGEWFQRNWVTNLTILSGDTGVIGNTGDNSYHVVTGSGVEDTALLDGFTISGGYANGSAPNNRGGGMYNSGGRSTLTNVNFYINSAIGSESYGGGMFNEDSSPTLTNVFFNSNSSGYGGGMFNSDSNLNLTIVTFSENSAVNYHGGGMYNGNSSPTLNDVTFNDNVTSYWGGGMYNSSSSPTLTNVTFNSNRAPNGGGGVYNRFNSNPILNNVTFINNNEQGMLNFLSSPSLTNVTFNNNIGSGMYNIEGSSPTLTNVIFNSNSASYGGGMFNSDSNPTLMNVTFNGNTARYGGRMYNGNSSPSLTNVTFSSNTATVTGGGIYNNYNSSPTLTNVTFSANSASYGGGMYTQNSSPILSNVTFSNNTAGSGGGMVNSGGSPIVTNSILWGNSPDQISGSATVTYSDVQGDWTGTGNIDTDPLLGPITDNDGFSQTIALGESSPAIDAGDPTNCPFIDQRGYYRPIDGDGDGTGICDMGAYEYASYPATFSLTIDIVGSGSVAKNPDKSEYLWGEVVTLTPIADPDWVFIGWGGDANGMDNPLSFTVYEDTNITANFRFDAWTITLSIFPEGSGEVVAYPDQPTYHYGDQVMLTALPNPGWSFAGWTGDASGTSSQIIVTMNDNLEITANFAQIKYSLSVSVSPPGMGAVAKLPNKPFYNYGDSVTLTANGATGWWLEYWTGNASGNSTPLTFTVVGNSTIVANFTDTYHTYLPAILK